MKKNKNNQPVVLVVEDDKPLSTAIAKKLELSDFFVITATSVNQALEYIDGSDRIDVVWLDHYLLGNEGGLDLVTKLKSNKETKKIPIFVVSNTATVDKVKTYMRLGVDKYYIKSNSRLEDIVNEMKNFLIN
jgi:DNA-binding response OmpR family regulator